MTKEPRAFAWLSQLVLYVLCVIAAICSWQPSVHDEYAVHDRSIGAKDCISYGERLDGGVTCQTIKAADGSLTQRLSYRASIWDDIEADRAFLQFFNERNDARIAKYSTWTRVGVIFVFSSVVLLELVFAVLAVTGPNKAYLGRLYPERRLKAALSIFCEVGKNFRFFIALFMFGGLVLYTLSLFGWVADTELGAVPVIAFILGLGGAAYSILSKLMTDKVFDQTLEIHQSITSFFGGYDVITNPDETNPKSARGMIKAARHSLTIYTGSPLVSFYRDPQAGMLIASSLMAKIQEMADRKFVVKLIYYSDDMEQKYLEAFLAANGSRLIHGKTPQEWHSSYQTQKAALLDTIRRMPTGTGRLTQHRPDEEPQVRFIVQDDKAALFWILESANPSGAASDARRSRARAAGFSTDTWHMIEILNGLFENAENAATDVPPPTASAGTA